MLVGCGLQEPLASWGNEYVRNLAGEIGQEFRERREAEGAVQDLLALVSQILPYHMSHNAGLPPSRLLSQAIFCVLPCAAHLSTHPVVLHSWCNTHHHQAALLA